jgi:predicted nucleic acid-binding protein
MIVVSDTSPLCYLLLIEGIEVLPQLFERVIIPQKVRDELLAPDAPKVVQEWISQPPDWLEIQTVTGQFDPALNQLDVGEQEAITLALQLKADLILLDDLAARRIATGLQQDIIGLLGILGSAAEKGLIDFPSAIARLQQTSFRASSKLIGSLL